MWSRLFHQVLRLSLVVGLLLCIFVKAWGVGAYPFPQKVVQPDGSSLTIQLHGDEWFNWVSTSDGYRILKNSEGVYEYATLLKSGKVVPSGVLASDVHQRDVAEHAFVQRLTKGPRVSKSTIDQIRAAKKAPLLKSGGSTLFAPTGQQKMLVILATFTDRQPNHSSATINALMNEVGYNGTGSFYDYYKEVSGGQLELLSSVTAWVTVPNTHEYYGAENKWAEFAYQAVKQASLAGVDFSQFDNDGDGIVEGIAIIHQGPGQEVTGNVNDIWSHSYQFSSAGYSSSARTFNGVKVDRYTVQPETKDNDGSINPIGVMCHEFGHNLGLPDYYDTDEETNGKYDGTGRWDVMAKGNYNGSPAGSSPAHHNPFSKIELGWANQTTITTAAQNTLNPIISSGEVLRINSPVNQEYILLENRQKEGFDSYLPGHGMLVYHVDEAWITSRRHSNRVNIEEHQGLYVMAAGTNINTSSAPYPGYLQKNQLTDVTIPAMKTWSDLPFNRSISSIEEINGVIYFDFMALQNGSPLTIEVENFGANENKISWTPSGNGYPVLLAWSSDGVFGTPEANTTYLPGETISGGGVVLQYGTDSTFNHTGLSPASPHHYRVWSNLGNSWSASLHAQKTTPAEPVTLFPWVEGFENNLSFWTQEALLSTNYWEIVAEGADKKPPSAAKGDKFATFYVPSFQVGSSRLTSPTLMLDGDKVYNLDFYHIQVPWGSDQDELEVYVKKTNQENWEELALFDGAVNEWTHRRYRLPYSEPMEISFVGIGNYGRGVGLDQIVISEGATCETSLEGVSDVELSNSTETTLHISWTLPVDEQVLVVARKNNELTELPESGTVYTASSEFSVGDAIGTDGYVVYAGAGTEVTVTGLTHTSNYHFSFFTFDNNHCYQIKPVERMFSTIPIYYNMNLEINDGVSPISGGKVSIDGSEYLTDATGKIYWTAAHDTIYQSVEVNIPNYIPRWFRYRAITDSTITLSLQPADNLVSVRNITHEKSNNLITLTWEPVIDESFEGYAPFSTSLAGWTQLDFDEGETYSMKNHQFPNQNYKGAFIVMDPHYDNILQTNYNMMAPSGRMLLAAFASQNAPNDDWLISPAFTVQSGDEISLFARSLTDKYGLESFRVLISVQEPAIGEFLPLIDEAEVPKEWTHYSYALSDYEGQLVKIAIHYNSHDKFAILIDDLRVGPTYTPIQPVSSFFVPNYVAKQKSEPEREKLGGEQTKQLKVISKAGGNQQPKGVGYSIQLNGETVGTVNGFIQTQFSKYAETCGINQFKVRTDYLSWGVSSSWSDDYEVIGCYRVKFVVKNELNEMLVGASVTLNGVELFTNNDGVVVFDGIESLIRHNFKVQADGYVTQQKSLSLTSFDKVVEITMATIIVDTTRLSTDNDKISIYPNPLLKGEPLYIDGVTPGSFYFYLYSMEGHLLQTIKPEGGSDVAIELISLNPGVYIIKLERGKDNRRIKLVVL